MFNIFKSNRMENLISALASVLNEPCSDPMTADWISIQSRGMKQWISIQLANKLGISANIKFLFPRQIIELLLDSMVQKHPESKQFNPDHLYWIVMRLIQSEKPNGSFSSIEDYFKDDATGKKQSQLCLKIANLFDDYQMYRSRMLLDWQKKNTWESSNDSSIQWQAALWNKMVSTSSFNHLAQKADEFITQGPGDSHADITSLPSRISLFGISTMPNLFLDIFESVSAYMDINIFLLSPSNQFYFDIKSAKQIEKIALQNELGVEQTKSLQFEMGNPLLSSFGTSGIKFNARLEQLNYHEPFDDLYEDPLCTDVSGRELLEDSANMLSILQSDIFNLVHRRSDGDHQPVTVSQTDQSIHIHACHSPMRESQVLKDLLLHEFEKDHDLNPDDIIVMMPDIESYSPFIDAVFSRENKLPFSISDRRKKSESEPLDAFLKILNLKNSRLEKTTVLDLLLSETIANRFKIDNDELSMIEKMVDDANILWGKSSDHRHSLDLADYPENTWQFGLDRLFMGMAMPENHDTPVKGVLPCQSYEGVDLEVLGKFSAFCDALFSGLESLAAPKDVVSWCHTFHQIIDSLLDRNQDSSVDLTFLMHTIEALKDTAEYTEFGDIVSFDVIGDVLKQKLDQSISQGRFLSGRITFCNIMPMRSIPFKIVVLMGMDEKAFPRQSFRPGFDLIQKYPQTGDKIERDEDRYLFLEILLSARSNFIVTYTGMSIQDNSTIPPSGVISELMDIMDDSFTFLDGKQYHYIHALHPFHPQYFLSDCNQVDGRQPGHPIKAGTIHSYSTENEKIAKVLSAQTGKKADKTTKDRPGIFGSGILGPDTLEPGKQNLKPPDVSNHMDMAMDITLDDLIRFFSNPIQAFMKDHLKISIPKIAEHTIDRENFTTMGLDQYILGNLLLEKSGLDHQFDGAQIDVYQTIKAMGVLPLGEKGRLEYNRVLNTVTPIIKAVEEIKTKAALKPFATQIQFDKGYISVNFSDIKEDGIYYVSYGKLTSARLLSGWLRHLFLNHCISDKKLADEYPLDNYPRDTFLIGRDPKGKKDLAIYQFSAIESNTGQIIKKLLRFYTKGIMNPFYFFCETSWQFAQAISKKEFKTDPQSVRDAINKSKIVWKGNNFLTGEKDNRYIERCIENNDPFESADKLLDSGFVENSIQIYKPMMAHMKIVS